MKLNELTVTETLAGLKNKDFSSVDITKACLARMDDVESKINAYVTVTEDDALASAKKADEEIAKGTSRPLIGVPLGIKDNFSTLGVRTTASSKVLDNYIPPFDSTVVAKLKDAGAVMLGKINMDAWAHGSSTETSDYEATKNPWDTTRIPGGSSGGSAAAVAADECIASIGSETAGSIRQPASWCGVVGLKPTYGRVSRYGVVAMASSLDSPGPITKTVEDAAIILQTLAGQDKLDATTSPNNVPNFSQNLNRDIKDLTIGISDDYFTGVNEEVKETIETAINDFEKLGAKIKKIKLFDPKYAIAVYTILQRAEVSSNLARYDGIRYGRDRTFFGDEAKRRIMVGTYVLSAGYYNAYYKKAQKVRTVIVDDFKRAFSEVDLILAPTNPVPALKLGESAGNPMFGELMDVLVEASSIAGLPGISIPAGFTKEKLPIGLQLIGPQFAEEIILNAAFQYEQNTPWHKEKVNL